MGICHSNNRKLIDHLPSRLKMASEETAEATQGSQPSFFSYSLSFYSAGLSLKCPAIPSGCHRGTLCFPWPSFYSDQLQSDLKCLHVLLDSIQNSHQPQRIFSSLEVFVSLAVYSLLCPASFFGFPFHFYILFNLRFRRHDVPWW